MAIDRQQLPGAGHATQLDAAADAWPKGRNVYAIVHTFYGTYADVQILQDGRIYLTAPRSPAVTGYSFVSLDSISYPQ